MAKPRINTMEELSRAIGVSRPTLSRFFQDQALVKRSTVLRIEAGWNVSITFRTSLPPG